MSDTLCIAVLVLLIISAIWDLCTREIPNWIPMCVLGCAIVRAFLNRTLWSSAAALVVCGAALFLFYIWSNRKGPETGIGGGDIKLMTVLSAITGFAGFLPMLVVTCVCGLLCVPFFRKKVLPLAPCLTAGYCFWYFTR